MPRLGIFVCILTFFANSTLAQETAISEDAAISAQFHSGMRFIPDEFRYDLIDRFETDFSGESQQRIILMHQEALSLSEDAEGEFVRELRVPLTVRDEILSHVGESHAENSRTYRGVELALRKFMESKYPGDTWENLLLEHGGPKVQSIPVFYAVKVTAEERAASEEERAAAEAARDALQEAVDATNGS